MSKLMRALIEAVTVIAATLAVIIGVFGALFGFEDLFALSGIFFGIWAGVVLIIHLAFSQKRRHIRLGLSLAASVLLMIGHFALFAAGAFEVSINPVPVIFIDFGTALTAMTMLSLAHLVVFRRRSFAAAAAPDQTTRVADGPPPPTGAGKINEADEVEPATA